MENGRYSTKWYASEYWTCLQLEPFYATCAVCTVHEIHCSLVLGAQGISVSLLGRVPWLDQQVAVWDYSFLLSFCKKPVPDPKALLFAEHHKWQKWLTLRFWPATAGTCLEVIAHVLKPCRAKIVTCQSTWRKTEGKNPWGKFHNRNQSVAPKCLYKHAKPGELERKTDSGKWRKSKSKRNRNKSDKKVKQDKFSRKTKGIHERIRSETQRTGSKLDERKANG